MSAAIQSLIATADHWRAEAARYRVGSPLHQIYRALADAFDAWAIRGVRPCTTSCLRAIAADLAPLGMTDLADRVRHEVVHVSRVERAWDQSADDAMQDAHDRCRVLAFRKRA
jgi:hypothetical protein